MHVTLNSDDPALMGIDLTHEFEVARNELDFSDDDFRTMTRNALAASFLPEKVKEEARRTHFQWLDEAIPA